MEIATLILGMILAVGFIWIGLQLGEYRRGKDDE